MPVTMSGSPNAASPPPAERMIGSTLLAAKPTFYEQNRYDAASHNKSLGYERNLDTFAGKVGISQMFEEQAAGGTMGGLIKDLDGYQVSLQGKLHEIAAQAGYKDEKAVAQQRGLATDVAKFEGQTAKMYDDNENIVDFDKYQVAEKGFTLAGRKMEGEGNSGLAGYHGIYKDVIRDQHNEMSEQEEMMALMQVDLDEHEQDLIDAKKAMAAKLDTDGDGVVEEHEQFSPELEKLFLSMNAYASRYNVDLFRAFKSNGGRFTADGEGVMVKTKFTSVLLSTFVRMARCIKEELLNEILDKFGTGPADPMTGNKLDVKWRLFCNYVGERYMTFPPIG